MENTFANFPDSSDEASNCTVEPGFIIRIKLVCQTSVETLDIQLVQNQFADYKNGLIGIDTPLAKAIIGQKIDETIPFLNGDIISIYIENIMAVEISDPADKHKER